MLFAMVEHLELPCPWRLTLTAGWNLAESLGLPVVGYLIGAKFGGRDAGMVAATAVVWLTVIGRKVFTSSVPGLLTISALVLTLQSAVVIMTGSLLFFLLQFPLANLGLCLLFAGLSWPCFLATPYRSRVDRICQLEPVACLTRLLVRGLPWNKQASGHRQRTKESPKNPISGWI